MNMMASFLLALAPWLSALCGPAAAPAAPLQDAPTIPPYQQRKQELMRQAAQAFARNDVATGNRLTAEAWAVQADIDWDSLRADCAEEAFNEARRLGWMGLPPWELRPRRRQELPRTDGPLPVLQDEPLPVFERPQRPRPGPTAQVETWPYLATAPFHHTRSNTWHSILNTPPFEEALTPPEGTWLLRSWLELSTSDYQNSTGGGRSQWITDCHMEIFELNYSWTNQIQFGLRLAVGELFEYQDNEIRVFEEGQQIVLTGERGLDADSLVLRAKYAGEGGFGSIGLLAELKFPLGYAESMLSSSTFDLGFSGLLTKRWDEIALHANLGFVLPIGAPDMFVDDFDDVSPYFHGAIGVTYTATPAIVLGLQLEGNTTAFKDLAALDDPIFAILAHARFQTSATTALGAGLQMGLNDASGDFMLGTTFDVTF